MYIFIYVYMYICIYVYNVYNVYNVYMYIYVYMYICMCKRICIYSLVPALGTAQTRIRLVKLVNSVTKFSRGIDKFH